MPINRQICFVIMPFSKTKEEHTEEYWTAHFEAFLKPLIEANPALEARRSQALRGDILRQIITDLVLSHVVVADLTDYNPNVFWELGVRQSFKHGTITIAEDGTKLPFDVSGKGTLWYLLKDHTKMKLFRGQFTNAIQDCLEHPERPDSLVLETLSGRGTLFELFGKDEALRRLDALITECDHNLMQINDIAGIFEVNQKRSNRKLMPLNRLRPSAIELLVTERYLNEEKSFFDTAEKYINTILKINEELSLLNMQPDAIQSWFLKSKESWIRDISLFKADIEVARGRLRQRF